VIAFDIQKKKKELKSGTAMRRPFITDSAFGRF
jgi:hypothetical protein